MCEKQETVTILLSRYRKMEDEIKELRVKVEEKTIVKSIIPTAYMNVFLFILYAITVCLIFRN